MTTLSPGRQLLISEATRQSPYFQIALYACGQTLALVVALIAYLLWDVLSSFREPLLWAWLCSIALKDIKCFLIDTAKRELQQSTLPVCVFKLCFFPLVIMWQLLSDLRVKFYVEFEQIQRERLQAREERRMSRASSVSVFEPSADVDYDAAEDGSPSPMIGGIDSFSFSQPGGPMVPPLRMLQPLSSTSDGGGGGSGGSSGSTSPRLGGSELRARREARGSRGCSPSRSEPLGAAATASSQAASVTDAPLAATSGRMQPSASHSASPGSSPDGSPKKRRQRRTAVGQLPNHQRQPSRLGSGQLPQAPDATAAAAAVHGQLLSAAARPAGAEGAAEAEGAAGVESGAAHSALDTLVVVLTAVATHVEWWFFWMQHACGVILQALGVLGRKQGEARKPSRPLFTWLIRGIVVHECYNWAVSFWVAEKPLIIIIVATVTVAAGLPFLFRLPFLEVFLDAKRAERVRLQAEQSLRSLQEMERGRINHLWRAVRAGCSSLDRQLRQLLVSITDAAVAALLIVGLVVGSCIISAVLVIKIGDESRGAVVKVNELVRVKGPEANLTGIWRLFEDYEDHLAAVIQNAVPAVTNLVETKVGDFLEAHNMTRVLKDLEGLYYALRLTGECSAKQRQRLAVDVAAASMRLAQLQELRSGLSVELDTRQERLQDLAGRWELLWLASLDTPTAVNGPQLISITGGGNGVVGAGGGYRRQLSLKQAGGPGAAGGALYLPRNYGRSEGLDKALVEARQQLSVVQERASSAVRDAESAAEELLLAERKLWSCMPQLYGNASRGNGSPSVRARAQLIYDSTKRLELRNASNELRSLVGDLVTVVQSGNVSVPRMAQAAAAPLMGVVRSIGGVFISGVGSTTAVALEVGLGVVKFVVQSLVFASVLYYLLALDIDPVHRLMQLLPIADATRTKASAALTNAMRGVFVSSLKLLAFHAMFTWLTLRAAGAHFVFLSTVASAVIAILPFVPVCLVVIPAVIELAVLKDQLLRAAALGAAHFVAWYFADDLIYREIEPSMPYLTALGIFGGMYTFNNPLQGVLLGPMLLALLSVGYSLHRHL